MTIFFKTIVI